MGLKLITHYGVFVYHHGHKSMVVAKNKGKDIEAIKKESAALFSKKIRWTIKLN